jgi:hypothetical protein
MNKKTSIVSVLSITAIVLFSYQNCGVEPPQSLFDKLQTYKFPYEAKINQIAYMSCSEQEGVLNDSGVFFTFRVGAHGSNAGLRLSDSFLYETRREDNEDRAFLLADEAGSLNHRVQFSLREQADLSAMYTNDGTSGIEGRDYDFIFGDLGSKEMSASLVSLAPGEYLNYWAAGGIARDAYMLGDITFNASESMAGLLRTFLTDKGILALGFATPSQQSILLNRGSYNLDSQDDDGDGNEDDADDDIVPFDEAYGLGYRLKFKQPNPQNWQYAGPPHINMPKRVLESIQEYDLSGITNNSVSWNCPTNLQLRVVLPEHAMRNDIGTQQLCPDPDPARPLTGSDLDNFRIVRNSLPASDWKINWARKCVVPLKSTLGSCYGISAIPDPITRAQVTRDPVYNTTQSCNPAVAPGVCGHYVSICLRP